MGCAFNSTKRLNQHHKGVSLLQTSPENVHLQQDWLELWPQRKPDYRLEQLDDELLLYHPNENQIVYLNQTVSMVWGLCDGKRSVKMIIELLEKAYPEAASSIPADVPKILDKFYEAGCIEIKREAGP
jgi:hypothetical protein